MLFYLNDPRFIGEQPVMWGVYDFQGDMGLELCQWWRLTWDLGANWWNWTRRPTRNCLPQRLSETIHVGSNGHGLVSFPSSAEPPSVPAECDSGLASMEVKRTQSQREPRSPGKAAELLCLPLVTVLVWPVCRVSSLHTCHVGDECVNSLLLQLPRRWK